MELKAAQDLCREMAMRHYENFPVGKFVPAALRPHVHAIYAFARSADDFADEPAFEGQRLEQLALWRKKLHTIDRSSPADPIFWALAHTVKSQQIPVVWLDDLLNAFESDVRQSRHKTFEDLLAYSKQSANPVGRLVLWLHGYRDEQRFLWSDAICTALQLANFWQDVAVDWKKDRVYLPQQDLLHYQYSESDLSQGVINGAWTALLSHQIRKTRALFEQGKPLCDHVSGRLRFELRLVWNGGMRILEKIEEHQYDVFRRRPTLQRMDQARLLWRALAWKTT